MKKYFVDPNRVISVPLMKFWCFNDNVTRRTLQMKALETYILWQVCKTSGGWAISLFDMRHITCESFRLPGKINF
jgi:hypothetical protein